MGTFHQDKGELHGITVVVDMEGDRVYVGRCWEMNDREVVLLDADEHADGEDGRSKEEFIRRAAEVGVWKKHDRVVLPAADVASVTRLGDVEV
ncbi:MAG: hypothetical protein GWN99_07650 [Gemmatimonadetes bacterium]|uniref:Uncharacterized protein n=1 Tax=Candidatus Kutchimonas denitrificans TaxID=3056748 RepID=A0AAE4Z9F7_9BACT|nr:hypothetical protein [Gemmatimonadota bacterium]NIR75102.1 hypothetical protein [Candidatus Kutchimonas denitrificans]NIS00934.1 hypothetical protein [Gemmatimonadota bacterium]NIT66551.1 hypothetical protein [Gemmatimonadota bacterium]NIU52897.1 hypothetical protein [Gemmatimonadota bacterium]